MVVCVNVTHFEILLICEPIGLELARKELRSKIFWSHQLAFAIKGAGTNMKVVGHVSIRREAPEKNFYRAPPTFYTVPP